MPRIPDRPDWLAAARDHWRWRGSQRPPFAVLPGPGQQSVWDFPRPPVLAPDEREVRILWGTREVACTRRAIRVLETAHPPTFYLPLADVDMRLLQPAAGSSFCEWKGPARYWSLVSSQASPQTGSQAGFQAGPQAKLQAKLQAGSSSDAADTLPRVAWGYPQPLAGAEALADCVAFYAWPQLLCTVGGAPAWPQPGGFYGGWVTPELTGPFKGDPGSEGW